jgi:hypothetical protein
MDPAAAGLIGAAIGAIAGVAGSLISAHIQARGERLAFIRQRKAEAYAKAVQHLFRAAARRSEISAQGMPVLSREDQREWFLDLADGLHSLTAVIAYAGHGFRAELTEVLQHYGVAVAKLTEEGLDITPKVAAGVYQGIQPFETDKWKGSLMDVLWTAATSVQVIATADLSEYATLQEARTALSQ